MVECARVGNQRRRRNWRLKKFQPAPDFAANRSPGMHTAQTQVPNACQETFLTCYRGTQTDLRHAAYMRMAKVLLIQFLLAKWNVSLDARRIFDFGFGAGTFFRYCPESGHLFGVELDAVCVREVTAMLHRRGYRNVELQPMEPADWAV